MKNLDSNSPKRTLDYALPLISDRRTLPPITKTRLRKITDKFLKEAYVELVRELSKDERNKEMIVTDWEKKLRTMIKEYSRLEFITSCWIGNMNVDVFIPSLRFGEYQGLAIEVNGSYHNTRVQMKKDEYREIVLNEMRVYVLSVENTDIDNGKARKIVEYFLGWERLDSKAKRRLERKVYLKTILDHRKRITEKNLKLASIVLDAFEPQLLGSLKEEV